VYMYMDGCLNGVGAKHGNYARSHLHALRSRSKPEIVPQPLFGTLLSRVSALPL
jgi:hypothetical protein